MFMILKVLSYSKCLCVWVSEHKVSRVFFSEFSSTKTEGERMKEKENDSEQRERCRKKIQRGIYRKRERDTFRFVERDK